MCSHIPNRGEQMVRYYGYYSNVSRGKRKEKGTDDVIPCLLEPKVNSKAFRKNWARLIQKIYEVDPLICPKCKGAMRIISLIEDAQVIRDILTHLDSGWSDQDRHRKSTTRQTANTPLLTSKSNQTLTLSAATGNMPGMIISSHNVL
jgi:hypothetical protein